MDNLRILVPFNLNGLDLIKPIRNKINYPYWYFKKNLLHKLIKIGVKFTHASVISNKFEEKI